MIRVVEEKPKCVYKGRNGEEAHGSCTHPEEYHKEGTCWFIVKPELKDQPTNDKYCHCKIDPGFIKSFDSIERHEGKGWMEPEKCKECQGVGSIVIFKDPATKEVKTKKCPDCDGRGTSDLMITKYCAKCNHLGLIRVDIDLCLRCSSNSYI